MPPFLGAFFFCFHPAQATLQCRQPYEGASRRDLAICPRRCLRRVRPALRRRPVRRRHSSRRRRSASSLPRRRRIPFYPHRVHRPAAVPPKRLRLLLLTSRFPPVGGVISNDPVDACVLIRLVTGDPDTRASSLTIWLSLVPVAACAPSQMP